MSAIVRDSISTTLVNQLVTCKNDCEWLKNQKKEGAPMTVEHAPVKNETGVERTRGENDCWCDLFNAMTAYVQY